LRSSYINRNLAKRLTQFWDSQCTSWLGNSRQSNTSARCESRTGTAIRLSRRWRCILVILAQVARRHERHGVLPSRAERKPTRKQHPSSSAAFILWAYAAYACYANDSSSAFARLPVFRRPMSVLTLVFVVLKQHYSLLRRRKLY